MPSDRDPVRRSQRYDYLATLCTRIRFSPGGWEKTEIIVQPDVMDPGVFLYLVEYSRAGNREERYVRLTPERARLLARSLLLMADESEVDSNQEALIPQRVDPQAP